MLIRAFRLTPLALTLGLLAGACVPAPAAAPTPPATASPAPTRAPLPSATPLPAPPAPTAPPVLGHYAVLAPADMRADLDELFRRLESLHPHLYARRSQAEVAQDRERLARSWDQARSVLAYYQDLAALVNSLGDAHTTVSLPAAALRTVVQSERFLPLTLQFEAGRAYLIINTSDETGLPVGAEVLAIAGRPVGQLWAEAGRWLAPGRYLTPPDFWQLLGSAEGFVVQAVPPGAGDPVTFVVPTLAGGPYSQRAAEGAPAAMAYAPRPMEGAGVLTLNSLIGIGPALKSIFDRIQGDGVRGLILDLRANGGGQYDEIDALMDYLTDQPYRQCARRYQAPFAGQAAGPREAVCELKQPAVIPQRYLGPLVVLIGPDTASAAVTLATLLQDSGRAVLVGGETLAPASYCGDVPSEMTALPRTGLLYRSARTCFVRPSGAAEAGGVIPDVAVAMTVADQLAGRDPVLEQALSLLATTTPAP